MWRDLYLIWIIYFQFFVHLICNLGWRSHSRPILLQPNYPGGRWGGELDFSRFRITGACTKHLQSVPHEVEQAEEAKRTQTDQNPRQPAAVSKGWVTSLCGTIFAQTEATFCKTKETSTPIGVADIEKECSIKVWLIHYDHCNYGSTLAQFCPGPKRIS